jgi:ketosteroid isomerase-like protein
MSENLDLVRSIFAEWERGDFSSAEWAHPDIEFERPDGPNRGSWVGLAEMARGYREFLSVWEDYGMQADQIREIDADRVLALVHASGHGKTSGLDLGRMSSKSAGVFYIRGGKVTRIVHYFDRDRALADLGLER